MHSYRSPLFAVVVDVYPTYGWIRMSIDLPPSIDVHTHTMLVRSAVCVGVCVCLFVSEYFDPLAFAGRFWMLLLGVVRRLL